MLRANVQSRNRGNPVFSAASSHTLGIVALDEVAYWALQVPPTQQTAVMHQSQCLRDGPE